MRPDRVVASPRGNRVHPCFLVGLQILISVLSCAHGAPHAWLRLGSPEGEHYLGTPYHFLGDGPLHLVVEVPPADGHVLDLLWGAKNDQRGAQVKINDLTTMVEAGGYQGFEWQRIPLTAGAPTSTYQVVIQAVGTKPAFLAAIRLAEQDTPVDEVLPEGAAARMSMVPPPPTPLETWAASLRDPRLSVERRARLHGMQANEALRRCRDYVVGWLRHADPVTGLIPRNLGGDKHLWNGKDSAADNYAFMVLTAALTDCALYQGRMLNILRTEQRVATRSGGLPADYNFLQQGFDQEEEPLHRLIFHGSEYVKDGLMPITEWLGDTPWSERMVGIIDSILAQSTFATPYGNLPSGNIEVNGEMMQVLSRLYFKTGRDSYLDGACRIADYYLLADHHPTRNATVLHLRDHNCELISGLTEVYAACHAARPERAEIYRQPIHTMLNDILSHGVNKHGLMYVSVDPQTGAVLNDTIHDNWGYNYNGFYTVYLLDGVPAYREATRFALSNLKHAYWKFPWQGWGSDGIADSVEGAINLFNRESDVEGVAEWIDANMNRMLDMQKPNGVIEGWHGDGNYARTAILWALWKQQGVTLHPWREDVTVGAVWAEDRLHLVISADQEWKGKILFDHPRHRDVLNLPLDYPRINQFPEWFTVDRDRHYMIAHGPGETQRYTGNNLMDGLALELAEEAAMHLIVSGCLQ